MCEVLSNYELAYFKLVIMTYVNSIEDAKYLHNKYNIVGKDLKSKKSLTKPD